MPVMAHFKPFAESLEQWAAGPHPTDLRPPSIRSKPIDPNNQPTDDPGGPGSPDGQVTERSLYKGVFRAVNQARPASPSNSKLLTSPFRKRRLGSQVMGRRPPGA